MNFIRAFPPIPNVVPLINKQEHVISFSTCYDACMTGKFIEVQSWILKEPDIVSQIDSKGQSLLYACAASDHQEMPQMMQWLYEQHPPILKIVRLDGRTLMHLAVEREHLGVIEWLHGKNPSFIDQKDKNQLTPLHTIAFDEKISILKFFIDNIKLNASLIRLIAQNNCPRTLVFILENGVDPNYANSSKQTLLHLAAEAGQEQNVHCLVQHGALVNSLDLSKRTPLFLAVIQNQMSVVRWLIQNQGDLTALNEGGSLLHVAAFNGHLTLLKELVGHPICKSLINTKDCDGKTPLHKAIWGKQKYEMVDFLLKEGAEPNVKNNEGCTPLHLASKHGHIKSAEILLRNGARMDLVNAKRHLPFDLAIRYGADDFIHFFLQTSQRMQKKEMIVKDVEGHHYKLLLEAKKEGFLEEQILHLQIISYHYIEKKNFLIGAKILNASLALLYQLPAFTNGDHLAIFERYVLARLEQIEAMFLESKELKLPINQTSLADYRNQLKEIRKESRASKDKGQTIQQTLRKLTIAFKTLLSALIRDAQNILGPPPVQWACMGMGSMSRDEMCPYSDVEFAFLLEKESTQALEYFRTLSQILELRIINLGETKFPVFGDKFPSPTPDGFCMDPGGNTPLGVTDVYELIGTPITIAQFQKIQWMDRSIILPNALSHVCLVAGKEKLITQYTKEKKKVQELIDKQAKSKEKNHKVLAMRLLDGHIKEFSPELSKEKEETSAFGIKKELYRPIQEIISSLALFYQLKTKTTFTRIDELVNLGVFSSKGAENLKRAITQVLALRLKAHLFYQNEEEFLCHPEEGKPLDPHLMYFDEETLQTLHKIYQVLIPFHQCGEKFLASQSKKAFNSSLFYDESSTVQGASFDKNLQYAKAQEMRQQAVSLNPNDEYALLHLGAIEVKMGNSQYALPRYLKALEISRKKYGENHSVVAHSYMGIGVIYERLGDYEKALEYHQKALKIYCQVLGENHPNVATSYDNINNVYHQLGDYEKAIEYCHKALKIKLQVLGENHPDVAAGYNNIGTVYSDLGDYEKALEYQQKALKFRLQVSGENHPDVATGYNNIGTIYGRLGEYEKALEYCQKALKIRLQVFEENHPEVATCYSNIGTIYGSLGDYEKNLEYYQKALKIFCQVLGENHPNVATSYNNNGLAYKNLGEYEKAIEYYQKALKISLQVLGENHPDVATSYNNIGQFYSRLGDYEKAIEYHQKTLKIFCQVLGENHPNVATSYNNNGLAYKDLGDYEKALEYCQKALKIFCQVLGENHPYVAISYSDIGIVYERLGDYEKALEYCQKALKIRLQVLKENHPEVATIYSNIGTIYGSLGDYEKVLEYCQKALKIRLQVLGENHPDVATSYNKYGLAYKNLGEYEKAIEYYQKALKIRLQVLGENHPDVATSYHNIGCVYENLGDYEKALNHFKMAVEIFCRTYKQSHPNILTALKSLIIVAEELQPLQLKTLKPTYAICVETLGAEHELTKKLSELIESCS